jgi:F1F0 ATPase subunit 2
MNEAIILAASMLAGILLGTFFFGGLWWTIRKGPPSEWSGLVFAGSFMVRTAVAIAGFYFVSHGDWRKLIACLVGFLIARIVVTQLIRLPSHKTPLFIEEGRE